MRRFDQRCTAAGIEHRLTPPGGLPINGMVKRFNEVLATYRFH